MFDSAHNALLDGVDGRAYVIEHGEKRAIPVHAHDDLSFGVAWCDSQACSASWDGRVLCTDLASRATRTAVDARSVTPWLTGRGGRCFTAAASGGVFDLRSPTKPIYEHRHEPYRLAVSPDGQYIASGDWGGDLVVYDIARGQIAAIRERAHAGRITDVAWTDEYLVSGGADGMVRIWNPSLAERRAWRMESAVRYLGAAKGTVGAFLDDGGLWMFSTRGNFEHHVELGAVSSSLAVSASGDFLAAGTNSGDVIVLAADGRAAAIGFGHGRISCLSFESDAMLVVCTPSGRVMRVPLEAMSFQSNAR